MQLDRLDSAMDKAPLRVAVVEPVGGHGGMDYYDFGLCEGLWASGVRPHLYTSDKTDISAGHLFPVHLSFRKIFSNQPRWLRGVRYLGAACKTLLDVSCKRIPVVHCHFFAVGFAELWMVLLARGLRKKVVVTVHDVEPFDERRSNPALARLTYACTHHLIVHNETSKTLLTHRLGVSPHRVSVVPHGNFVKAFPVLSSREAARLRLHWPEDKFILLFFGQLKRTKGLDLLLRALSRVVTGGNEAIELVIAGKETDIPFAEYEKLIEELHLQRFCRADIRFIPNAEVPDFYRAADLIVLPYRRIYQSGVLIMAMSLKVPVLASDLPAMRELVQDSETGFLFRDGDIRDLARQITAIAADEKKRIAVAQTAFTAVECSLSWQRIGQRMSAIYANLAP